MTGNDDKDSEAAQAAAATLIQRVWRGKHNNIRESHLDPDSRWDDTAVHAKLAVHRQAALHDNNSPRQRWRRAIFFVNQMRDKNRILQEDGVLVDAEDKQLETQHWLELVDGAAAIATVLIVSITRSNTSVLGRPASVKWYHKKWQEDETQENFFKWLDFGGGKDLSLDQCPRERLEKERIIYLSAEQRLNYLVKISADGRILWAKNDQPVDTTAGHWKDTGNGQGIVPDGMPTSSSEQTNKRPSPFSGNISESSSEQGNAATHYAGNSATHNSWLRHLKRYLTPRGIMEKLLRKTVQKNTWIYVSDKNFNIFIGIKETGAFQHSSFTAGGVVTSAGLITVKRGVIHTLSPLSGHYRTSVQHFHKFIDVLTERGVDMSKVQISKAEAALWGIEHLAKFKKHRSRALGSGTKKVKQAGENVKLHLTDTSHWKREILHGRRPRKLDEQDKKP